MVQYRKKQAPCKGRKRRTCKTAKRKCLWASGKTRSYCRKSAKKRRTSSKSK